MTFDELKAMETRLLYKGKRCIEVRFYDRNRLGGIERAPDGYVYVTTLVYSMDTDNHATRTRIGSTGLWSLANIEGMTVGDLVNAMKETITALEIHEVSELLKLDDKRIFHPHKLPVAFKNEKKKKEAA